MRPLYFFTPYFFQKFIIWLPSRLFFKFFCHLTVEGLDKIKELKGPVILASNHTSEIDVFVIPTSFPFSSEFLPTFFTSREARLYEHLGLRAFIYGGLLFKTMGAYPVLAGKNDFSKSLSNVMEVLSDGGTVLVFPEGRIPNDSKIGEAKAGIGYLLQKTWRPVVPIKLSGSYKLSFSKILLRKTWIKVVFGNPINPEKFFSSREKEYTYDEYKEISKQIMEEIRLL
jgi:1-acyl-sn-glycerol-3-phosphate acyltransferase